MTFRIILFAVGFSVLLSTASFAGFVQGKAAYDRKNWKDAILNLRPIAEEGDARAMILLANMYASGYGVERDDREAFLLYRRAAVANNADGMLATATLYQSGKGIPKNMPLAIGWYKRGAQLGDQTSAFFYAIHLYQGSKGEDFDIQPDHVLAYQWFRIASNRYGNRKIQTAATDMAAKLKEQLSKDQIQAAEDVVAIWKPYAVSELGALPEEIFIETQKTAEEDKKEAVQDKKTDDDIEIEDVSEDQDVTP